jgi:SAM-dependent methyltransferase
MNRARLQLLLARAWHDVAAAQSAALVVDGDRNGWYRALASGPHNAASLAATNGSEPRLAEMWLVNQAAAGYITFDPATRAYTMDEEQRAAFADESRPDFVPAGFALALALGTADARAAIARMSAIQANALAHLWLSGVKAQLDAGASLLEIGCGEGGASRQLAATFPHARLHAIDLQLPMRVDDLPSNLTFEMRDAARVEGQWDVMLAVDVVHEFRDPGATLAHLASHLGESGAMIIVEPLAGDPMEQNFNTAGRLISSAAWRHCLREAPASLGPLTGEATLRKVLTDAGFRRIERIEEPYHLVLEARLR